MLEDADFFPSSIDWLLISPIIHLHLATWLIAIGFVSHLVGKKWDDVGGDIGELNIRMRIVPILCLALLFMWAILFRPGYAVHDMGLIWVIIGLGSALRVSFSPSMLLVSGQRSPRSLALLSVLVSSDWVIGHNWLQHHGSKNQDACPTMLSSGLH